MAEESKTPTTETLTDSTTTTTTILTTSLTTFFTTTHTTTYTIYSQPPTSTPNGTSTFSYITSSSNTTDQASNASALSEGEVAIICGVVFGVLGLAIAVVVFYIIARKRKEKKHRDSQRRLGSQKSASEPYEHIQKDSDNDHYYKGSTLNTRETDATLSISTEVSRKDKDRPPSQMYENQASDHNAPSSNKVEEEANKEYESITLPLSTQPLDRNSSNYILMNAQPHGSNNNSDSTKENPLTQSDSYVNMKDLQLDKFSIDAGQDNGTSNYVNTTLPMHNGQNGQSHGRSLTKSKPFKLSKKKKKKYALNEELSGELTYKL
ncbi:hypothetical protein Bpfe_019949 [Biomphalaria pfeifferi]|uniref:Uncharacterized protein n=1 Tax=Biomphalaria pfeifferi TaxID=112525 RepID=A0AAD8F3Q3_BIOPF|nr:hypothetical protein Bpfe_019949 [Biomphalaria pfeifferi]